MRALRVAAETLGAWHYEDQVESGFHALVEGTAVQLSVRGEACRARLHAPHDVPLDLGLVWSSPSGTLPSHAVATADEQSRAAVLRRPEVCSALDDLAMDLREADVTVDDDGLTATTFFSGFFGPDADRIIAMLRRLAWAAQAIGRALASVPPASALGGAFAAWSEVARQTGVRVRPTPLILQGRRDGLEAAARAVRRGFQSYGFTLTARAETSLRLQLLIQARTDGVERWVLARPPLELGHAEFARQFDAFSDYPERARERLVPELLTALVGLSRHGAVRVDDVVLALDLAALPADPAAVVGILEELTQAGARLHPSHRPASPYR